MSIINLSKWVKVGRSGVFLTKKGVKAMLIGEYNPSIDLKGRLHFPARLREDLGDKFIVTKGLDNCLFVYSLSEWAELEAKIKALPMSRSRTLQRFFFAGAVEVEPDKQGAHPHSRQPAGICPSGQGCHRSRRLGAGGDLGYSSVSGPVQ